MKRLPILGAVLLVACGGEPDTPPSEPPGIARPAFEPPVLTNAESPIFYPAPLYDDGVEGTVVLRLYADETGALAPDSTQVAEGSGFPDLDSAALAGVGAMQFAPARRAGLPVATAFLQPVHFRRPEGASGGGTQP